MAQVQRCEKCGEWGLTLRVWPGDAAQAARPSSSVQRICVGCIERSGVTRRQLRSRIRRDDHRDDVEAISLGLLDAITGEIVVAPCEDVL